MRDLLRPVVYWHVFYVFETDVARQPLPESYSTEKMEVRVYTREKDDFLRAKLAHCGHLCLGLINDTRLNRGDAVAIVCASGEPAGYGWLSFSSGVVELAFGITWIVRAQEV